MKRSRSQWLLRLSILPIAGLLIFLWATRERPASFLTLENRSGKDIVRLEITVGAQKHSFADVAPGAKVTTPFALEGTEQLAVDAQLANGALVRMPPTTLKGVAPKLVVLPGGEIMIHQPGRH